MAAKSATKHSGATPGSLSQHDAHDMPLRIGALAEAAGVNVETIRYYQRIGLMPVPDRPLGGQRGYAPGTVDRLRFIKRAQQLGFSLDEIAELLKLEAGVDRASIRRIAGARLEQIHSRMGDLQRMAHTLEHLLEVCAHAPGRHRCPIIRAITDPTATDTHTGPHAAHHH